MAMEESTAIEEILRILVEDEELIKNWKGLADSLGLGIADSVSLKNLYKQSTTTATDFFSEILSRWRSVKGQGATVANLVETLESLDFKGTAEKIEAAFNDLLKWNASIEEIRKNEKTGALAIELLHILSYFNPEGTDLEFLKTVHRGTLSPEEHDRSEEKYEEALSLINDHSLFKCENEVISIHCLVQKVIRRNCSCGNLDESLLRKLVQSMDNILMELKKCDMPHVLSVWKHVFTHDELVKEFRCFPSDIIYRFEELSMYKEMLDFANLSYGSLNRILGDKHLETLEVESLAAKALSLNGKYDEALQKFTVVVERQKSVLRKEHLATLTTETNMAGVLYLLDRFNEAKELCKRVLESDKKIPGKNQEVTIVTKGLMANILCKQGKNMEATEIYEEVLEWQKNELGEDEEDLETLTTRHNIGCCLLKQKEFTQAKGIFADVLKLRLKMLGEKHSKTLTTKCMLALTFNSLGESEKGLEMLKDVWLSRKNVLGQEHPVTINTREEIDSICRRKISDQLATTIDPPVRVSERIQTPLNPANEAEDLSFPLSLQKFSVVHEEQRSALGNEDPTTLVTGHNLGRLLFRLGRYDEALEAFKSVLESRKKVFGGNNQETIATKGGMAIVLSSQGKYREAMELHEEVLEWEKTELCEEDPYTLTCRHNIGICLWKQKEFIKARGIFEEVLEWKLKVWGKEHSSTLATKHMLARTLHRLGESADGLKMLKDVLVSREEVLGHEHPDTIKTRREIDRINRRTIPAQPDRKSDPSVRVSEGLQTTLDPGNEAERTEAEALAIELLNFISYFEADGIRFEFLKKVHRGRINPEDQSDEIYEEALTLIIKSYSRIKFENDVISIHLMQQDVTQDNCHSENVEESVLRTLVKSIDTIMDVLKECDMPHVLSVWKYAFTYDEIVKDFRKFPRSVTSRFCQLSMYKEMLDFANLSYKTLSRILGDKHSETLEMERLVDDALMHNEKYEEVLQKFTDVHESQKSTLGKDHPTTLYTGNYRAEVLFHLDRNDEALELYNSILESEKKVLGETHEDTIKTKENIAAILRLQGKYTESMKVYEDALEWRTTALGEEHQLTLAARHNVGYYLYKQKDFTKAKGIFEDVLELRLKVLGEEDSETLLTKDMLARTLDSLVLVSQENVLGIQHPDTIMTRENIRIISSRSTIPAQSVTKTDSTVRVSGSTGNTTTTDVGTTFTRSGSSRTRGSTTVPPDTEVPTNTVAELPGLNRETLDERMADTISSLAEKDQVGQDQSGDEQQPPKKKYKSQ